MVSIVIPLHNEEASLPRLMERLLPVLQRNGEDWELILVDDGSTDSTRELLRSMAGRDGVRAICLSRNFGQQAAILAGLDHAEGDCVAVMDADLQDPPELLPEMLRKQREGFDVVSAKRRSRPGDGWLKRITAKLFYSLMGPALQPEVGEFRLYSRRVVLLLRQMRERHRFLRGIVSWLGLPEAVVEYQRGGREAGETKYSYAKMARLAWTALVSTRGVPLHLVVWAGMVMAGAGALGLIVSWGTWPGLLAGQLTVGGILLLGLGIVGDAVARVYEESQGRPLYVVSEVWTRTEAQALAKAAGNRI